MRNPQRIHRIINQLSLIMSLNPEDSFFTVLNNVLGDQVNYYIEDDIVEFKFTQCVKAPVPITLIPDPLKHTILDFIYKAWVEVPDWRFLQLINNFFADYENAPEYYASMPDQVIVDAIKQTFPEKYVEY